MRWRFVAGTGLQPAREQKLRQARGTDHSSRHVAWLYDLNNTFQGTLDMTQSNKVSLDGNSYTGTFDAKFFDPSGTQFMEITGTMAAERLVR